MQKKTRFSLVKIFIFLAVGLAGWVFVSAGQALEKSLSVPLQVINRTDAQMPAFPVSGGISFAEGIVFPEDVSSLSVVDDQGRPVPAQFDPFVLWWGTGTCAQNCRKTGDFYHQCCCPPWGVWG